MVVDLPAPLGPSNAKKSPSSTDRLIPLSAWTLHLYVFARLFISSSLIINVPDYTSHQTYIPSDKITHYLALVYLVYG